MLIPVVSMRAGTQALASVGKLKNVHAISIMLHCCAISKHMLEHPLNPKPPPANGPILSSCSSLQAASVPVFNSFPYFNCSGMGASAIGLSHVAVQFPVYEFLKRWLGERRQKERGEASVADRLSTVDLIVASSTSKVIGFGFPDVPPAPLPAYQHAVCASVATVTPPNNVLACPLVVCCVMQIFFSLESFVLGRGVQPKLAA